MMLHYAAVHYLQLSITRLGLHPVTCEFYSFSICMRVQSWVDMITQ